MTTSRLFSHNIHTVEEYREAIKRQSHFTVKQKDALIASPQIATYDRGEVSPLGGLARKASDGPFQLKRAEPLRAATANAIRKLEREKPWTPLVTAKRQSPMVLFGVVLPAVIDGTRLALTGWATQRKP
jgi:hypothetical protein